MKLNEVNSLKNFNFSCIYLWTNVINNKAYVGSTRNFYQRMSQYRQGKFNRHMKSAINKYGIDNFELSILEKDVDIEHLLTREQFWIDWFQSYNTNNGYNIAPKAGNTLGCFHSSDTKAKISAILKKFYEDENNRNRYRGENNPMFNYQYSPEQLKKKSEAIKQVWKRPEYRQKQSENMSGENNNMYGIHLFGELNGMYGKKHSEATKKKISDKNKGNKWTQEQKSKISKKVICLDTGKIYDSIYLAAEEMGCSYQAIYNATTNPKKRSMGYRWKIYSN